MVHTAESINNLNATQLRELTLSLISQIQQKENEESKLDLMLAAQQKELSAKQEEYEALKAEHTELMSTLTDNDKELLYRQVKIDQLTFELATLKRLKFAAKSEKYTDGQRRLFDESLEIDFAAIQAKLDVIAPNRPKVNQEDQQVSKRVALPANLPRVKVLHEPDSTVCTTVGCGCKLFRFGEDVTEKLDYVPGTFTVEEHVRGKWACRACSTVTQSPVPAQIIDKGLPTAALLAYVLISKYADHVPLYRQESMFGRAGYSIPRSTLSRWVGRCGVHLQPIVDALKGAVLRNGVLHADETPIQVLSPGDKKTKRGYIWAYTPSKFEDLKAVIYDFCPSRAGSHALEFLQDWSGTLVVDQYAGYKGVFRTGVKPAACWAHARRKFEELFVSSKSPIAEDALKFIGEIYRLERMLADCDQETRLSVRIEQIKPYVLDLFDWMKVQRQKVTDGTAIAKALDYSLKCEVELKAFLENGQVPIDNNHVENTIRPIALGRKNFLFLGSEQSGTSSAAVMSLINSAKMNGLDPLKYMTDVLTRLPTQPNSRIEELFPHNWKPLQN